MHARTVCLAVALALAPGVAAAQAADTTVRAAIGPAGEPVQLLMTSGGKSPGLTLTVGKYYRITGGSTQQPLTVSVVRTHIGG